MKVAICVSFYLSCISVNKAYNWKPLQTSNEMIVLCIFKCHVLSVVILKPCKLILKQ